MPSMFQDRKTRWVTLVCVALVTAVVVGLFGYAVQVRAPWFGASPASLETWLNSGVMLWAKYWYREGPLHLWFGYFWLPRSIEFPTLESRDMYSSYPPGATLPVYLFSRVTGHEPSIATVMGFALFSQAATIAALTALAFLFTRKAGGSLFDAACLACIPAAICLFLPAPAFLFQMAYFHIAVLPVFAVFVLIEFIRDECEGAQVPPWLGLLQGALACYGLLCDWLFVFVLACVFLKRLVRGQITNGGLKAAVATFGIGPGLALGMFALTLWHFDRFETVSGRFAERSALDSNQFLVPTTKTFFWSFHIVRGYGVTGRWLVLGSAALLALLIAYLLIRRLWRARPNPILVSAVSLTFILLPPCMMHVFVFRQDSSHFFHYFTTAKFTLVLAVIPFILAPAAVLAVFGRGLDVLSPGYWWSCKSGGCTNTPLLLRWSVATPLLLALAVVYTAHESTKTMKQFTVLSKVDTSRAPSFLGANTGYEDMVFTPNSILEIGNDPTRLAHSMKCVYMAASLDVIYEKAREVEGEYVINLFMQARPSPNVPPDWEPLIKLAFDRRSDDKLVLYKIRKSDFLRTCQAAGLLQQ